MGKLTQFFKDEEGVTAIEYSLIAALIAIVIVIVVTAVGGSINDVFQEISDVLNAAVT